MIVQSHSSIETYILIPKINNSRLSKGRGTGNCKQCHTEKEVHVYCYVVALPTFIRSICGVMVFYATVNKNKFQFNRGGQFYWWRKQEYSENTTDLP
jgi:hypothetical protein